MTAEVNKQFFFIVIRYMVVFVMGRLVLNNAIPQDFADAVTESLIGVVAAACITVVPLVWAWSKTRWNVLVTRTARDAPAGTSMTRIVELARIKQTNNL